MTKVVYIHGRPSGHPIHDAYAKSLRADFVPVDFILNWQAKEKQNKFKRFLSWITCALFFPNRKKYDVFFCEGVREPLLFMKWFGFIRPPKKLVALMANETLYFLSIKKYGRLAEFIMKSFLNNCDALICIGRYQTELANKLFPNTKTYTIFNGISKTSMLLFQEVKPALFSKKILVISNCSSMPRMYYKGLDLAFEVFNYCLNVDQDIELHIVGDCSDEVMSFCKKIVNEKFQYKIFFHGHSDIRSHFKSSGLLLQLGRGDSFPTTTIEAAAAGVPVFVSDETGTKELLLKIDSFYITNLSAKDISGKVIEYMKTSDYEKKIISAKFKEVALTYTEENANLQFLKVFAEICKNSD